MKNLENIFETRLATLKAIIGEDIDVKSYSNVYEVDLAILKAIEEGGGGLLPEDVREIIEEYGYTTMEEVEAKQYMQQKKLSLNGDDPLQILDEAGNVLTYNDVKALVDNKALFVYMLVDNAFYIPCGDMVVPSGKNAVEFSSAFIVDGGANMARIIINTDNEVLYEQYWLADKEWVRGQGYLTSVKTINGESIVGEGNIEISGGGDEVYDDCFYTEITDTTYTATILLNIPSFITGSYGDSSFLYSYDAKNWVDYNIGDNVSFSSRNRRIYWRGNEGCTCKNVNWNQFVRFVRGGKFDVGGNIMSLISYNYRGLTNVSVGDGFVNLFYLSNVKDASKLILPVLTSGTIDVFRNMFALSASLVYPPKEIILSPYSSGLTAMSTMFQNCTSLKETPLIKNFSTSAVAEGKWVLAMFSGCTSLEKVSINLIDNSWGLTQSWLYGVPAYGTFCNIGNRVDIPVGAKGIPEGWAMTYSLPNDVDDQNATPGTTYSSAKIDATFVKTLPLTQAEYDELPEKDINTLYIITDAE